MLTVTLSQLRLELPLIMPLLLTLTMLMSEMVQIGLKFMSLKLSFNVVKII
jgi:hypothetical protein